MKNIGNEKKKIQLVHQDTNKYLYSNKKYQFNRPISGQLEVSVILKDKNDQLENINWKVEQGIYFSSD